MRVPSIHISRTLKMFKCCDRWDVIIGDVMFSSLRFSQDIDVVYYQMFISKKSRQKKLDRRNFYIAT